MRVTMLVLGLAVAALAHPITPAASPSGRIDFLAATQRALPTPKRKARSRYLLPDAELPAEDAPDIRVRWKLRKVKLTMALPSI
jgi:hypothetical protein